VSEQTSVYRIEVDGSRIHSKDDFFRELSAATGIAHVKNLDALDEDLTHEIPLCCGPFAIIWNHADKSDWSGNSGLTQVLGVLAHQQQCFPSHFRSLELLFDSDPTADAWSFPAAYESPFYRNERRKRGVA
jgi:RNAse (barnase) inhibitor barstar